MPSATDTPPASHCGGLRLRGITAQSTSDKPLVTVITATFNAAEHLVPCIESVLAQNYPNIEHLIFDGGSTDGTLDILRRYDDRIALWRSQPDKGVYDAWNNALDEARGEWVAYIGADDEYLPGAIAAYIELARQNPNADYISSRALWLHPSGYERIIGLPWSWPAFSNHMTTTHVGSFHRRSLYNSLGKYDITFPTAADYELLLRARNRLRTAFMPTVTVKMRAGGLSDKAPALEEAKRVKLVAGSRHPWMASIDHVIAWVKFILRPLRRAIKKLMSN